MKNSIIFSIFCWLITILCKLYFSTQLMWGGFSPIIAIALISGITLEKNVSFLLPLVSLFISDIVIEILNCFHLFPFHGLYTGQILNYGLLLAVTMIGWLAKNYRLLVSLVGPMFFFITSNFFVWFFGGLGYADNCYGLISCYIAGIPFLLNSITATLVFLPLLTLLSSKKNILVV